MNLADFLAESTLQATVMLAAPLLLAAYGELLIERAGMLNLALEGQMTLAAAAVFAAVFTFGEGTIQLIAGIGVGVLASAAIGLLLGRLFITHNVNQIPAGLSVLIFSLGGAALIYRMAVGFRTSPPRIATLKDRELPFLSDIPWLGEVLFKQTAIVYLALLLVIPIFWFLFRTTAGLRLRAAGENPKSVDSLGLPLNRIRYGALLAGSALIGLAGAFFPLVLTGGFSESIVGGRGWLAILLVIFGRWKPLHILFGALLFAYLDTLQFQFAVTNPDIPKQILQSLPYVLAMVVLAGVYRRAEAPVALAKPYEREARF